jgi:hypothetical protein
MKAKKTSRKGKPAAKRTTKDLAPRKSKDVTGGFGSLGSMMAQLTGGSDV